MYMPTFLLSVGLAFTSEIQACSLRPCEDNLKICLKDDAEIGADCSVIVGGGLEECPPGSHELKFPKASILETSPASSRGNSLECSTVIKLAINRYN